MSKTTKSQNHKKERLDEIKQLVRSFCDEYLNDEYESYALKLCDTLGRKRKIDMTKGRREIWAAAIIYVIARLNFLFDRASDHFITPETICDFFETVKSTTGNKATLIEKQCDLYIGAQGYCRPEITDMVTFYETPEGFIISKSMLKDKEIEIEFVDDEEFEQQTIEQRRKKELEERAAMKRKQAEKHKNDDQLGLF